jgi:hypothetical protein
MFLVAMFIVYFDYMLSIVSLSLCLCISLYSIHPNKVPWVGGRDHISVVLICYLPTNTPYILGSPLPECRLRTSGPVTNEGRGFCTQTSLINASYVRI